MFRGKFALAQSAVNKVGKVSIFPLYYLIHFSGWKWGFSKFGNELLTSYTQVAVASINLTNGREERHQ